MRLTTFILALYPVFLVAQDIGLVQVASGIANPAVIANSGDGSGRLFIAEQAGRIRILKDGQLLDRPFLDITSRVLCCNERGLLGIAFPPGFAQSQRFYIHYTNRAGDTVIALYRLTSDPNVADPSSETILLTQDQPFPNHNGGQLAFGPDGYLYIGLGDGGSGGDPMNNAQRTSTLLGKILRIDVEGNPGSVRIPPTNPFVNAPGARGEIWALGLRNPWRFSFDRATGDLWIGDVGQDNWEEVDYQPAASHGGENYGWHVLEGFHCYNATTCNTLGYTLPVAEYPHVDGACSITGGYLYRGARSPGLRGTYLYADYCTGAIFGLRRNTGTSAAPFVTPMLVDTDFLITTLGEDEGGEVYVADGRAGGIYRLQGTPPLPFTAANAVNAATFAPGLVAGSLGTVFVQGVRHAEGISAAQSLPLPTSIDDVSVTLDGIDAPLLAVVNVNGTEQVNFQVPYEVRGHESVTMLVRHGTDVSDPVTVPLKTRQPGVFAEPGGQLAVVVRNADYSLLTEVLPGDSVFVYATGLGPATNEPLSGAAAPSGPLALARGSVKVSISGIPCNVQFAGLAPGFAGVFQINFKVPQNAQPGIRTLQVSVDGVDAPVVTIMVATAQ